MQKKKRFKYERDVENMSNNKTQKRNILAVRILLVAVSFVIASACLLTSCSADNTVDSKVYGVAVSDLDELNGAKRAELSEGVQNIIKRARQLYEIKWTALSDFESYHSLNGESSPNSDVGQNLYFRKGMEYQGIPYGQPVHKGSYVGFGSAIEDFIAAVSDKNSNIYTTYGENTWYFTDHGGPIKYSPYFSTDCSGVVSYAWGLSGRNTTGMIAEATLKEGDAGYEDAKFQFVGKKIEDMKVGYALNKAYSHIILIYDIVYDSSGDIIQVTTFEQTPPYIRIRVWGAGGNAGSLRALQDKIDIDGYDIIRYTGMDDVKYEQNDAVPLNKEKYKNNVSNPISATVSEGVVKGEAIVTEDSYQIEGWTYNEKGIKKVEYSVDGGTWQEAETEEYGGVLRYKSSSAVKMTGAHTVKVRGVTSDGNYEIAEFAVKNAPEGYSFTARFDDFTGCFLDPAKNSVSVGISDFSSPQKARVSLSGWGVSTESVKSFEYKIDDGIWLPLETNFRYDVYKNRKDYQESCKAYNSFSGGFEMSHLDGGASYTVYVRGVSANNDVFEFAQVTIELGEGIVNIFGLELEEGIFYLILNIIVAVVIAVVGLVVVLIVVKKKKKAKTGNAGTENSEAEIAGEATMEETATETGVEAESSETAESQETVHQESNSSEN